MKMKRVVAVLLVVVMAFSCVGVTAVADDRGIISVYAEEYSANVSLTANGNDIRMRSMLYSGSDIEKIVFETTLEKFWGLFIWTKYSGPVTRLYRTDGKEKVCVWDNAVIGAEQGTYRLKCVFHITKLNGQKVTLTKYSNEVKVPN